MPTVGCAKTKADVWRDKNWLPATVLDQGLPVAAKLVANSDATVDASGRIIPTIQAKLVFKLKDYVSFGVLTVIGYAIIAYVARQWFSTDDWVLHPFAFWSMTLLFASRISVGQLRWWLLPFMKKPVPIRPRAGMRVGVATTFVPGAEPLEMLEATVRAMVAMDYPHDTWVLDEGDDPAVRDVCKRLGARHFSRKNLSKYQTQAGIFQSHTKYGNYNSWLYEIGFRDYEIVAAFDPDHVPDAGFLTEVLGYFEDPQIGYVQSAQVYYNQKASFIARGAAEETYAYYSSTQMFCYGMGYPIVTGCHNTHRTTALREVGGFAAHDADDLLITLLYRTSGWKGVYIPKALARGLTPVDWNGYLKQQLRWARSVLDIKFRIHPKLLGKLKPREIIVNLLHGFYYFQGVTTFLAMMLVAFMLATAYLPRVVEYLFSINCALVALVLLVFEFYRQRFYIDPKKEWGLHWRAGILQLAKYPYLVLALLQVVLNRRYRYELTIKTSDKPLGYSPLLPHMFVAVAICMAWIFGAVTIGNSPPLLKLLAAITILGTCLLTATDLGSFPAPFDAHLLSTALEEKSGHASKQTVP